MMIRDIFSAVYNSNVEMEFCRRSVVGTNCFWSKRGVFFLTWLLNGTNRGMSSLSVYSLGLSKKKKKDVAFFFVRSEHSYYNYFHTFSIRKRGGFFFQILILYDHAYLDIR